MFLPILYKLKITFMKFFNRVLPFLIIGFVLSFYFFSSSDETQGQNDFSHIYADKDYVEGELIVMLNEGKNIDDLTKSFTDIDLRVKEVLVNHMNIYLLEYDVTRSSAPDALISVLRRSEVAIAQFNHTNVTERQSLNFPNDPRFNEQWDYHNTGQGGGTPGADVKGPAAWSITTGGVTSLGDTIVSAVVDNGFFLTHQDLDFWRNWGEIPANGIDDDGNGYIDDVNGWNAYNNNGTITSQQHGTHVSGTVGAVSNNNVGVAGTNWNVKVMAVQGSSGTESVVVIAYGYVLKQRKIYNQTNGTQGAFVVSTNASFGVDFGNPSNYPLWCAMYDSLGNAGILSAGATMNNNSNVDVTGDVPTACPSDFLISVTNTTNLDVKNSSAAWGPTTIDIGAPGTAILSTNPSNAYGTSTGTSMASPHVAGAVALMFAGAGSNFIQLGRTQPDSLARYFKHVMLSTVDTLPSLTGIIVSNGRLNLYKAVNKVKIVPVPVLNPFNLQSPSPGTTITTYPLSGINYTFTWDTSATGAEYKFVFGSPTIATRKIQVPVGTNSITFTSGQLDNILSGLGVSQGSSMAGQWTAWATRQLPTVDSLAAANGPRTLTFARGVPPLTAFNLSSPPNNFTLHTTSTDFTSQNFNWTKSGQGVKYKWMFASPDFSSPGNIKRIYESANSGFDSTVGIRKSALDSLAASLGASNTDSIQGQWRIYAYSAGDSLSSAQTHNITLRRLPIFTITIGTGTSQEAYPLDRYFNYMRWQGLWTNSELNNFTGNILKIRFYQNNSVSDNMQNVKIWMMETPQSTLPTGNWDSTGMSLVYSGNVQTMSSPGWLEINLTTPFSHTAGNNLMISCTRDFQQYITSYPQFAYTSTPTYLSRRNRSDTQYPVSLTQSFLRGNIQIEYTTATGIEGNLTLGVPNVYTLGQNYPNPFNPSTKINFGIPRSGLVTIKVYDLLGKEIATLINEEKQAGYYDIEFNASHLASGAYFYRIQSNDFVETRRMMLIK
jgi:hypothetical protein